MDQVANARSLQIAARPAHGRGARAREERRLVCARCMHTISGRQMGAFVGEDVGLQSLRETGTLAGEKEKGNGCGVMRGCICPSRDGDSCDGRDWCAVPLVDGSRAEPRDMPLRDSARHRELDAEAALCLADLMFACIDRMRLLFASAHARSTLA